MSSNAALFVSLGWQILEHKCRYYIHDRPIIDDYSYDMLEKQYEKLADELSFPKSATDMVGFNQDRPCCQRVMEKLAYLTRAKAKKAY